MEELSRDNKPAASFKQSKTPGILYQVQIIKKRLYIPSVYRAVALVAPESGALLLVLAVRSLIMALNIPLKRWT